MLIRGKQGCDPQKYLASDKRNSVGDVALKILRDDFVNDPKRVARFLREAKVLTSLNHPHITQIYGFEDSGDIHVLVMELVVNTPQ